jgi:hypothetical protein
VQKLSAGTNRKPFARSNVELGSRLPSSIVHPRMGAKRW